MTEFSENQIEEQNSQAETAIEPKPIPQPKPKKKRPKPKKKIGFFKLFGYFVRLDFG